MIYIVIILVIFSLIMFLCGKTAGYNYAVGSKRDVITFTLLGLVSAIFIIFGITMVVKVVDNPTPYCNICERYYDDNFVYCPIDGVELEKK